MTIYYCIFYLVISPLATLYDNDELLSVMVGYENKKDFKGLSAFNEKLIIENLKKMGVKHLHSKNLQKTLFYYIKCKNRKSLKIELMNHYLGFENWNCFFGPLQNILNNISKNIGRLNAECGEFKENTDFTQKIFKTIDDKIRYLNH